MFIQCGLVVIGYDIVCEIQLKLSSSVVDQYWLNWVPWFYNCWAWPSIYGQQEFLYVARTNEKPQGSETKKNVSDSNVF